LPIPGSHDPFNDEEPKPLLYQRYMSEICVVRVLLIVGDTLRSAILF
jgi:hypothetical protein